jgi:hypothetical protein
MTHLLAANTSSEGANASSNCFSVISSTSSTKSVSLRRGAVNRKRRSWSEKKRIDEALEKPLPPLSSSCPIIPPLPFTSTSSSMFLPTVSPPLSRTPSWEGTPTFTHTCGRYLGKMEHLEVPKSHYVDETRRALEWNESAKRHEEMQDIERERRNGTYVNLNKPLPLLPRRQTTTVQTIVVKRPLAISSITGQQARTARFCESFDELPLTPDSEETAFDPLAGHRFLAEEEATIPFSEEVEHQHHPS